MELLVCLENKAPREVWDRKDLLVCLVASVQKVCKTISCYSHLCNLVFEFKMKAQRVLLEKQVTEALKVLVSIIFPFTTF